MTVRLYADEFRCAIYDEAPGGGDPLDPASLMNRPVVSPYSWLSYLYFHSEIDYYSVVAKNLSIPVSLPAIPTVSTIIGQGLATTPTFVYYGQTVSTDQLLLTHGLGYVPKFYSIFNGVFMSTGTPIQTISFNRARYACVYATASEIRLFSVGTSSDVDLDAINLNVGVMVFRQHAAIPGEEQLFIEPGDVNFGMRKFDGSQPHLRVTGLGDAQYLVAQGKTADSRGGGLRTYIGNTPFDFGFYTGSMPAPSYIAVTAGV